MPTITATDLTMTYMNPGVDAALMEPSEARVIDRADRSSVLDFINWYCATRKGPKGAPLDKLQALRIERMIRKYLPSDQRTFAQISTWLDAA